MIRFKNVSKNYNGQLALNNIYLTLHKGEMAFLTGHSGAGKSTLLKIIAKIEDATRGEVLVDDLNLAKLRSKQIPLLRRRIGIIFQNPQLLHEQTVFENIATPLVIAGYRQNEIKRRVRAALDKVGLLTKENFYPMALSCGEQQRVGIARAIVNKPTIVLADEPTGNLDQDLSLEIMRLFEAFNAVGVTFLIATHNLSLATSLHHRVITLKQGQIVADTHNTHLNAEIDLIDETLLDSEMIPAGDDCE